MNEDHPLSIMMISVHGLIRSHDLELGRDADTGGQTTYVVELARALGEHPDVGRVDLLTRLVADPEIDGDYAKPYERLSENARIVRIGCGGTRYMVKEDLWDSLDEFFDNTLDYIRGLPGLPDVIHSHYADAGLIGARLSRQLGIPQVHTGHSLGRVKRRRLLAAGHTREDVETRYHMSRRIAAEEEALSTAAMVITSTRQEIDDQYAHYDYYSPDQMRVIPPGTDLERFHPPQGEEWTTPAGHVIYRFLKEPALPIILALSRPDHRKNIATLIEAYGTSPRLREAANLVLVAGNRRDIGQMESGTRMVFTDILLAVDRHDLYGKVAYPKQHLPDDVPDFYRLAALSCGVFVNPALTEPFGLTLLEAAASGVPVVATEDGGPVDIIENCANGVLIDPLDPEAIGEAILSILEDDQRRTAFVMNGLTGVRRHYSWRSHADKYVKALREPLAEARPLPRHAAQLGATPYRDRAIFTDIDHNLLGDDGSIAEFSEMIDRNRKRFTFGIATARRLDSALAIIRSRGIPQPDVLITSLGTEIHYAPGLTRDEVWADHVDHLWHRIEIRRILSVVPGLTPQPPSEQSIFKLSYDIDPDVAPDPAEIRSILLQQEQSVNVFVSYGKYLDVVPERASKGFALRWFADQREVPLEHVLTAGGSGADEDVMRGNTLAVVVGDRHHEELSGLRDERQIYFANRPGAGGILEAIEHYDFFGACRPTEEND